MERLWPVSEPKEPLESDRTSAPNFRRIFLKQKKAVKENMRPGKYFAPHSSSIEKIEWRFSNTRPIETVSFWPTVKSSQGNSLPIFQKSGVKFFVLLPMSQCMIRWWISVDAGRDPSTIEHSSHLAEFQEEQNNPLGSSIKPISEKFPSI